MFTTQMFYLLGQRVKSSSLTEYLIQSLSPLWKDIRMSYPHYYFTCYRRHDRTAEEKKKIDIHIQHSYLFYFPTEGLSLSLQGFNQTPSVIQDSILISTR